MTDWEKLIGKRILAKSKDTLGIRELKVLEISPAKKYVKVHDMLTSRTEWLPREELDNDYEVLEVLESESLPEKIKYLKTLKQVAEYLSKNAIIIEPCEDGVIVHKGDEKKKYSSFNEAIEKELYER